MNATTQLLVFSTLGLGAANGSTWFALRRDSPAALGTLAFALGCFGWLGLGLWLDPRLLAATHPYHALVSGAALYVVMGFPAFVLSRLREK